MLHARYAGFGIESRATGEEHSAILKTYSTKDAPYVAKAAYWNELLQRYCKPLEVTPSEQVRFDAQFRIDSIGPLSIRRTVSMPARIDVAEELATPAARQRFFLLMPVLGAVKATHYGRQTLLEPGDFALFDGTAAGRLEFDEPNTSFHVVLSGPDLRARLPAPENLCGLKSSRDKPYGRVMRSLLEDVWQQIERGFPQEQGLTIAKSLLEIVAAAYALQHGRRFAESPSISARRAHIKRFIEARLHDSELSPAFIADYFGVSTRYVSMIFEKEREPVSAYILRRRLEECAHQLSSPLWASHSVTEIARQWCFVNRAHFSRVFKRRFGVSPREYRRINQL